MGYLLSFLLGFVCCFSLHFFVFRDLKNIVKSMDEKYKQLLNIVQQWQKKI